jgi:uncharacterized membrane protein YfcA
MANVFNELRIMAENNEFIKKNIDGIFPLIDHNIFKLMFIGIFTGVVASFIGGGGPMLIVPMLIYLNVLSDYKIAIGTSLASLLLPIGFVAAYFFAQEISFGSSQKCIKWNYAFTIAAFFVLGTFASYFTSKIEPHIFKSIFAIATIFMGFFILFDTQ